jgi:hypothetical protein
MVSDAVRSETRQVNEREWKRLEEKKKRKAQDGEIIARMDVPSVFVATAMDFLVSFGEDILEVA